MAEISNHNIYQITKQKHSQSDKTVIEINNVVENKVSVQNQVLEHPNDDHNDAELEANN